MTTVIWEMSLRKLSLTYLLGGLYDFAIGYACLIWLRIVRADTVLGLGFGEFIVAVVEKSDTEAFALGSYYCQVARTFRFIHPLEADYFLL